MHIALVGSLFLRRKSLNSNKLLLRQYIGDPHHHDTNRIRDSWPWWYRDNIVCVSVCIVYSDPLYIPPSTIVVFQTRSICMPICVHKKCPVPLTTNAGFGIQHLFLFCEISWGRPHNLKRKKGQVHHFHSSPYAKRKWFDPWQIVQKHRSSRQTPMLM